MFERGVSADDVRSVLENGEVVEDYPEDAAYPGRLMLGWRGKRPLHVVSAFMAANDEAVIVTVYEPNSAQWQSGFKRRKA
jgi:hypothetical protein